MYIHIEEPTESISTDAVKVWRISNTIGHVTAIVITIALLLCADWFGWYGWISTVLYIISGIIVLSAIYSIVIEPVYLQRTWRYSMDQQFAQLKHGKWKVKHTLIPMEKVEYVRTEQGPIMRRFQVFNLEIGTTTSSHVIPAIPAEAAQKLKEQIAVFAKITEKELAEGDNGA